MVCPCTDFFSALYGDKHSKTLQFGTVLYKLGLHSNSHGQKKVATYGRKCTAKKPCNTMTKMDWLRMQKEKTNKARNNQTNTEKRREKNSDLITLYSQFLKTFLRFSSHHLGTFKVL